MSTATVTIRPDPRRTMLLTEFKLLTREPVSVVWGVVLPVLAFVVLGLIPAIGRSSAELGGLSFLEVYEQVIVLLAATMLALASLTQVLANYREWGVLRRLSVTPMPASRLLGTQLVLHLAAALFGAVAVLVVGEVAFGVGPGVHTPVWLLTFVLAAVAMFGLGLVIAALAANGRIAGAVGPALFFPLMFGAGLWVPRPSMPGVLRSICDWTPLGAANRAMLAAAVGHLPPVGAAIALLAYAVCLSVLAVRLFRWE